MPSPSANVPLDPEELAFRKDFIREVRQLQLESDYTLSHELEKHFDCLVERYLSGEIDEVQLKRQVMLPWVN